MNASCRAVCSLLTGAFTAMGPAFVRGYEPPAPNSGAFQAPALPVDTAKTAPAIASPSPAPPDNANAPILTPAQFQKDPATSRAPAMPALLATAQSPRLYGGAEYLLWWVKEAPLGVPLISTGPVSTTHHGWLDRPDSTILYGAPFPGIRGGNATQNFPSFSGSRLTLGYWLDADQRFAIEGSGFMLARQTAGFEIRSGSNGLPVINIPVFNTVPYSRVAGMLGSPPAEDGLPASLPSDPSRFDGNSGVTEGGVKITNTLRLWGSDATGVINLFRNANWNVSGLLGFQYLDLSETLSLSYDSRGASGMYVDEVGAATDTFQTRNQFFGGVLGIRGRYLFGPLTVELTGKIGLGDSHEVQNVWGGFYASRYLRNPYATGPEGVFAQPANEGRRSDNRFAAVPEAQMKVGYALTQRLRLTAGYDFLFWSSVLRPGDQINRNLPKGQLFQQGPSTDSTTSPAPYFNSTHFFAHGVSLGIDFRY